MTPATEYIGFLQEVTVYVTLEQPLTGFAYDPRASDGEPRRLRSCLQKTRRARFTYTTRTPVVCTVDTESGALTILSGGGEGGGGGPGPHPGLRL